MWWKRENERKEQKQKAKSSHGWLHSTRRATDIVYCPWKPYCLPGMKAIFENSDISTSLSGAALRPPKLLSLWRVFAVLVTYRIAFLLAPN